MPSIFSCYFIVCILVQVPFLTLDLEDIAERLSNVDIAKRLFIEPDLFPPELVCVLICNLMIFASLLCFACLYLFIISSSH